MTDVPDREPRRLFEASGNEDLLARAIGAARDDGPDAKALDRLAMRLPLVGVAAAAKAAGAAAAAKSSSIAPAAAISPTLSGALIGAALGVVVAGGGFAWQAVRGDPPPAPVAPALVQAPPVAPPEPAPVAPPPPPEATTAPDAIASAAPRASASAAAAPSASASASAIAPSDETEAHLLERARDALASDPSRALALTDEHARRFTGGALGQEREVVAIQALVRLGRRADARARADRFLAQNPATAHRRRLEALLGD